MTELITVLSNAVDVLRLRLGQESDFDVVMDAVLAIQQLERKVQALGDFARLRADDMIGRPFEGAGR